MIVFLIFFPQSNKNELKKFQKDFMKYPQENENTLK